MESGSQADRATTRVQFLLQVYEQTGGNQTNPVNARDIGNQLDVSRDETRAIVTYLKEKDLLKSGDGGTITITAAGIRQVELEVDIADSLQTKRFQFLARVYQDTAGEVSLNYS